MRTTVELPDDLLKQARQKADETGISLKQFFVAAVELKLSALQKVRREPPVVQGPENMRMVTREEIHEAMFG